MTPPDQYRVRLAEVVGKSTLITRFDPFTCADDDYAVLEWMRELASKYTGTNSDYYEFYQVYWHLPDAQNYIIGDYARAALKVLPTGSGIRDFNK